MFRRSLPLWVAAATAAADWSPFTSTLALVALVAGTVGLAAFVWSVLPLPVVARAPLAVALAIPMAAVLAFTVLQVSMLWLGAVVLCIALLVLRLRDHPRAPQPQPPAA